MTRRSQPKCHMPALDRKEVSENYILAMNINWDALSMKPSLM